jgi:dipeptidyl aminopeptidase/acylaminoacyl peptidase
MPRILALGLFGVIALGFLATAAARRQTPPPPLPEASANPVRQKLQNVEEGLQFTGEALTRSLDEQSFFQRLADIAEVDRVRYTGPPPRVIKNPTAQGASNPVIVPAFTFMPKKIPDKERIPLLVFAHGGVHGNLDSSFIHIIRELVQQGYAIIAPDYRGSSGYDKEYWQLIDYGGLEIEDVHAGRQWMLEAYDRIDPARVGIVGWSHGGLITLMTLFAHPKDYKVGYAGVPVCDLVARMGYKSQQYRDLFSAPYHIGKTAEDDVKEYRRRSPAWNAEKLQTPLLIHTNTNDEDVNVLEVEHLIKSLKAAERPFEHKIYKDAAGGHEFNRIDTKLARESRAEVYRFLAKYLSPPNR